MTCAILHRMADSSRPTAPHYLTNHYDRAAGGWGDKMRSLGYYDAYLGFLSSVLPRADAASRVLDIGCGTGAFAEGWAAIHGMQSQISLLDPSAAMLDRASAALSRRGLSAERVQTMLEDYDAPLPYDHLLAAHVLEHCDDALTGLTQMRVLTKTGGTLWLAASKPHWCNAIIWLKWRHRAFRPEEITSAFTNTGWMLEGEYPFPSGPPSRTSRGYLARAI